MNFSQKEAILFTFSLYHEFRTSWKFTIHVVWAWSGQTRLFNACVWFSIKGGRWINSSCHLSFYKSSAFTSVIRRLNCVIHMRILHCLIHISLGSKKSFTVHLKLVKYLFTAIVGQIFLQVLRWRLLNCSCLVRRSRSHSEPTWSCTRSTILNELCVSFLLINSLLHRVLINVFGMNRHFPGWFLCRTCLQNIFDFHNLLRLIIHFVIVTFFS